MERKWVVARTQPRREAWAAVNVRQQGCRYYLPRFLDDRGRVKFLFPSYLFVEIRGQWRFLLSTFGISKILMIGDDPQFMPIQQLKAMQARENADGFISLPHASAKFKLGDRVRIKQKGAFEDVVGIYDGSSAQDRERILLDVLGRKTAVLIASDKIELD